MQFICPECSANTFIIMRNGVEFGDLFIQSEHEKNGYKKTNEVNFEQWGETWVECDRGHKVEDEEVEQEILDLFG